MNLEADSFPILILFQMPTNLVTMKVRKMIPIDYLKNISQMKPAYEGIDLSYLKAVWKVWEDKRDNFTIIRDEEQGNVSFISYFTTQKRDLRTQVGVFPGLMILLCKFLPVAVFAGHTIEKTKHGENWPYPKFENFGTLPSGDWTEEMNFINELWMRHGITWLDQEEFSRISPMKLPYDNLVTCYDQETVFDAVFYWDD